MRRAVSKVNFEEEYAPHVIPADSRARRGKPVCLDLFTQAAASAEILRILVGAQSCGYCCLVDGRSAEKCRRNLAEELLPCRSDLRRGRIWRDMSVPVHIHAHVLNGRQFRPGCLQLCARISTEIIAVPGAIRDGAMIDAGNTLEEGWPEWAVVQIGQLSPGHEFLDVQVLGHLQVRQLSAIIAIEPVGQKVWDDLSFPRITSAVHEDYWPVLHLQTVPRGQPSEDSDVASR